MALLRKRRAYVDSFHNDKSNFSFLSLPEVRELTVDEYQNNVVFRVGTLTVLSLGSFINNSTKKAAYNNAFNSERFLFPPGFTSVRIHSAPLKMINSKHLNDRNRVLYRCCVLDGGAKLGTLFVIEPQCNGISKEDWPIVEKSAAAAVKEFRRLVIPIVDASSQDDTSTSRWIPPWKRFKSLSNRREISLTSWGLTPEHFFGFGIPTIAQKLEVLPGVTGICLPSDNRIRYRLQYRRAPRSEIDLAWQQQQTTSLEEEFDNSISSGCARCEGFQSLEGNKKLKAARVAAGRLSEKASFATKTKSKSRSKGARVTNDSSITGTISNFGTINMQYRQLKSVPIKNRLESRRSTIHGWGLFVRKPIKKHGMIIEYVGEVCRQGVADLREKRYEEEGMGSCYLFRLDDEWIVDATRKGGIARFINHSCVPNAYSKTVKTESDDSPGNGRKIVIFALRDLMAGEEVLYDYKFAYEDDELACNCGHALCKGRMN